MLLRCLILVMKASFISIGVTESMVYGGIARKNQFETFVFSPFGTLMIVVIFLKFGMDSVSLFVVPFW